MQIMKAPHDSKMDLKSKANSTDYIKSLIFSRKECSIRKLLDLLDTTIDNRAAKQMLIKIFPIFFSFAELNRREIQECLILITKLKRHPSFAQEKSLFDGWQIRLKNLIPGMTKTGANETKSSENRFVNIPGTNMNEIIGYAELDLFFRFNKWLKYHKLHKYAYFFANLSFVEIERIDGENIRTFEAKVGLHPMTDGARNAILRKLVELNQRSNRLKTFCKSEYYTSVSKVEKSLHEIRMILRTPIRKKDLFSNTNNLPDLISNAMETVVSAILRLKKEELMKVYETAISLLKMAWGCSFFDDEVKEKFNVLQAALLSKKRSHSRRKVLSMKDNRIYIGQKTVHFIDIESGIQAITWYLENVVLKEI